MNNCQRNLGQILKQKRQTIKLTLHELSEASGVSPSHLGRIENGERYPSATILQRLAKPLCLSEGEIFTLAGYLSSDINDKTFTDKALSENNLDPYVVRMLSHEPVEVQRAIVEMLPLVKNVATSLVPEKADH